MSTNQFAYLCMWQDHEGPVGSLAGLPGGRSPSGPEKPGYKDGPVCYQVSFRCQLLSASSWPSVSFIHSCHHLLLDSDIKRPYLPWVPNTLGPTLFQICAPGTNSIGITWKLVRNVESQAPSPSRPINQNLQFHKIPRKFVFMSKLRNTDLEYS